MPAGTAVPDLSISFSQSVTIVLRRGSIARYTPSISGPPTSEWLTDAEILDRLITHPEQIFVEAGELLRSTLIVAMPPLLGHIRLVDDGSPVSPDDGIHIHLGTEQADRLMRPYGCASELLDGDGYALLAVAPRGDLLVDLFITGGSAYGVFFGVSWFLHTYLGARWLFPGKDGEVIPSVEGRASAPKTA